MWEMLNGQKLKRQPIADDLPEARWPENSDVDALD
jgi:hypothetical protein